jgi:Kdo2-lipid IVA lauroyltransferase/acyltransferase
MLGHIFLLADRLFHRVIPWISRLLAAFAFYVLRIRRRVALENLEKALDLSPSERRQLAEEAYVHLIRGALEFSMIGRLRPEQAAAILGEHSTRMISALLAREKGLLILTAHLGQWDLLACAAARCGFRVNVITRSIKNSWINRYWMNQRRRCGVNLLPSKGSARRVIAALRRNEIVAMVLDQHDPDGLILPFFGRKAATSSSLARLARITRAPVVPAFLIRRENAFFCKILDPIPIEVSSNRFQDLMTNTARFNEILEQSIRETPSQWLWLHRRWKADS